MAEEHCQGTTMFAGAQVRYLFHSAHGVLGAISSTASALYLKPRDTWMAWTNKQRQEYLYRVVGLRRFLLRSGVQQLGQLPAGKMLRRLPEDFARCYGYRPWLVETFVAPPQQGSCFKVA